MTGVGGSVGAELRAALEKSRREFRERREGMPPPVPPKSTAPRYDEVYHEGTRRLDVTMEAPPGAEGLMDDAKFATLKTFRPEDAALAMAEAERARASEAALSERVATLERALGDFLDEGYAFDGDLVAVAERARILLGLAPQSETP